MLRAAKSTHVAQPMHAAKLLSDGDGASPPDLATVPIGRRLAAVDPQWLVPPQWVPPEPMGAPISTEGRGSADQLQAEASYDYSDDTPADAAPPAYKGELSQSQPVRKARTGRSRRPGHFKTGWESFHAAVAAAAVASQSMRTPLARGALGAHDGMKAGRAGKGSGRMKTRSACGVVVTLPPYWQPVSLNVSASFRGRHVAAVLRVREGDADMRRAKLTCAPASVYVGDTVRCILYLEDSFGNRVVGGGGVLSSFGELHRMGEAGPLVLVKHLSNTSPSVEFVTTGVGAAGIVLLLRDNITSEVRNLLATVSVHERNGTAAGTQ